MKIYVTIATAVSVLFGFFPVLIAKFTDQGDELCDPDRYYSANPVCVLQWQETITAFALYFMISAVIFMATFFLWAAIKRLLHASDL